jgi:hypothetical protein
MQIFRLGPDDFYILMVGNIHDGYSHTIAQREHPAETIAQLTVHVKIKGLRVAPAFCIPVHKKTAIIKLGYK